MRPPLKMVPGGARAPPLSVTAGSWPIPAFLLEGIADGAGRTTLKSERTAVLLWSNPGLFTWVPTGCELHHDRDLLWPRVLPSLAALGYVVTPKSHTSACPESFKWRETKPELKAGFLKCQCFLNTTGVVTPWMPGPRPQETPTQGNICRMCDGTEGLAAEEQRTYRTGPESRSCGAPAPRSPAALAPASC